MKRPLKTLFYGMTHEHAAGKLATLRKLRDDFEVVAVVDDRPRGTPHFIDPACPVDASGFRVVTEQKADAITDIDVAFIETANADLMEIAAKFATRAIPMHCDKPCGESMEPYASIVETCRKKSIPLQIGYMYRGNPAVKWIWENVAKGIVGDVAFVEADMNHDYGSAGYAEYLSSFKSGILYNLGCHLVDLVLPVVRGELKETHAFVGPASGDPTWAKTSGAAFLRFGGTDSIVRTSSHMPGALMTRRLRIDGTEGTIDLCPIERFDGEELSLTLTRKGEAPRKVAFGVQTDRYAAQLIELAAIVRGERKYDAAESERDLRVHETTLRMCEL
ncbi:MAG: Gfo/Idh/MocA family oxidoreductase [Kiritimatiellae bacterium]|nr:Gfo/Idh/MocA family oxidoreductase [Kiritimatiellia bacterium]